jgi:uncharacterized protein YaaQ
MAKKMIMAVLDDMETKPVIRAIHEAGHPLTLIDTTGGLLRAGNSTLIAGVDETEVDNVIEIIDRECRASVNPFRKRATVMVIPVEHFEQIA